MQRHFRSTFFRGLRDGIIRVAEARAIASVILLLATTLWTGSVTAQGFPSKTVRLVVPFPAGGTLDVVGRTLAPPLSRALGQNVLVDNRPGGGTVIGTEHVARAPADGHSLLLIANSYTINPALRPKLPYDTLKDFAGVAGIAYTPIIIALHPSVPAKTLKELIALARARPGELTYASTGVGAGHHLAGEVLRQRANIDIFHVPYQGSAPAGAAVLGGHNGILVSNVPDVAPQVKAGRLRAIAVGSLTRAELLPDVPTVAESGFPGYDATIWYGSVTAAATPRDAIGRASAEIVRLLRTPEMKESLGKLGFYPSPRNPEEFDAFLRAEIVRNEKVARQANIRIE